MPAHKEQPFRPTKQAASAHSRITLGEERFCYGMVTKVSKSYRLAAKQLCSVHLLDSCWGTLVTRM